jgi:hypothetical protein
MDIVIDHMGRNIGQIDLPFSDSYVTIKTTAGMVTVDGGGYVYLNGAPLGTVDPNADADSLSAPNFPSVRN